EGDAVHQEIQLAEALAQRGEQGVDLRVLRDVARQHHRDVQLGGERADALFHPLSLVRQRHFGAFGPQHLCDAPGDAPLVGDAQDDALLSIHQSGHVSCLLAASRLCEAASPPHVVRGDASTRGQAFLFGVGFRGPDLEASISCEFGGMGVKIAYIVNPVAGSGRSWSVWQRLVARHPELERDAVVTQGPHDAERLAQEAADKGYEAVVAVGGDGTLHEVLNGALQSRRTPAVGVIPAGTGNDFARSATLPRDPERAYQVCRLGRAEPIDVGLVNGRAFINVAGFGFDAAVAEEVIRRSVEGGKTGSGAIPYLLAVFNQLRTFRPRELRIEVDGPAEPRRG